MPQKAVAQYLTCTVYGEKIVQDRTEFKVKDANAIKCVRYINTVSFIPSDTFKKFPNMRALIVINENSSTPLTGITKLSFKNGERLKYLAIRFNNIPEIKAQTFTYAQNLHYISLRQNKIAFVHELAFNSLNKLKVLDLDHNHIKTMVAGMFTPFIYLIGVRLTNNDCLNKTFLASDNSLKTIKSEIDANCNDLHGETSRIKELQLENFTLRRKSEQCPASTTETVNLGNEMCNCVTIQVTVIAIDSKFEYSNQQIKNLFEENAKIKKELEKHAKILKALNESCLNNPTVNKINGEINVLNHKLAECKSNNIFLDTEQIQRKME